VTEFDRGVVAEFRANGGWGFVPRWRAESASRSIETARTPVMVVTLEVRGPGSKTDNSPNMSDGPPGRSATGCRS
jgi:hypothetical protein